MPFCYPFHRFGVSGTQSGVNYTPMTELDYGTLLCWANNSIGTQESPCVFQIVAAGETDIFICDKMLSMTYLMILRKLEHNIFDVPIYSHLN